MTWKPLHAQLACAHSTHAQTPSVFNDSEASQELANSVKLHCRQQAPMQPFAGIILNYVAWHQVKRCALCGSVATSTAAIALQDGRYPQPQRRNLRAIHSNNTLFRLLVTTYEFT